MNSYKTLFRLELKSKFGTRGTARPIRTALKIIVGLALVAAVYFLYIFGIKQIAGMFCLYDMSTEFLILAIAISQIILIFFGISSVINTLYKSGDNELMMRFPVRPIAVFAARISILIMYQVIFTVVVDLPIFIIFGLETAQAWTYYALIPVTIIFSILLPLAVSNLLALPVMYISNRMKNWHTFSLILSVVLVAVGFALYMNIIQGVVNYMKEEAMSFFSRDNLESVSRVTKYLYPMNWLAFMMVGEKLVESTLSTIAVVGAFVVGAIFLIKRHYLKTIMRNIEGNGLSFSLKTKNKVLKPTTSIFHREFIEIFCSSTYSFQYLCMAVAAPVMVFYCNRLAATMGKDTIGAVIVPALALMVMLIFCVVILSFAASSISREGDNFYLTKIAPVPYINQVMVKFGLYMLVSTVSILATTLLIWLTKQVDVRSAFSAFGICFMMSVAITCFAIRLDVGRPQFAVGGDGELTAGNLSTFVVLFVGFAISVVYGLVGMVGIFLWGKPQTFGVLSGASGAFMIAAILWLVLGLNKKYDSIAQR